MIAQSGDLGVTGYVTQGFAEGAIGYVNYSYALGSQFPVAKVLNRAGYYTEPTPQNVAVSLLQARINTQAGPNYLTQNLDGVYADRDPRNYPLSSYSYFILPTRVQGQFNEAKGRTLGAFTYYAMCQAQQQSASLGYSPLPVNLVQASFNQIRRIPGVEVQRINVQECDNPTFSPDGTNLLAQNAPMPPECDRQGPTQCSTGSGGLADTPTPVDPAAQGNGDGGANGGGTGGPGAGANGNAGGGTTCDPETGVCTDAADGSSEVAAATPTVLAGSRGWSSAQTLMLLVTLFILALIFVPAFLWRGLARQRTEGEP
jgi:phosphate transport system substrate-binding protein